MGARHKRKRDSRSDEIRTGDEEKAYISNDDGSKHITNAGTEAEAVLLPLRLIHTTLVSRSTDSPLSKKQRAELVNKAKRTALNMPAKQTALDMTDEEELICRIVDAKLQRASFAKIAKALKQTSEMELSTNQVQRRFKKWEDD